MRRAIIISKLTGRSFVCHATTEHPDSHFGCPVWVDDLGKAYCDVDKPSPYYDVCEDVDGHPRVVIGQRIAELRKEQGMTQAQLAEAAGLKQSNVSRIEAGKYATTLDILANITQALGCKVDIIKE